MGESAKGRHNMILGRYLWSEQGLNFKSSDHVIKGDYGHFKGYTIPMVDFGMYDFKIFNSGKIHLNNHLEIITSKTYISLNMSVLLLNNYV